MPRHQGHDDSVIFEADLPQQQELWPAPIIPKDTVFYRLSCTSDENPFRGHRLRHLGLRTLDTDPPEVLASMPFRRSWLLSRCEGRASVDVLSPRTTSLNCVFARLVNFCQFIDPVPWAYASASIPR